MTRKSASLRSFGGNVVATLADIAGRIAKAGDTMTGTLTLRDVNGLNVNTPTNLVVQAANNGNALTEPMSGSNVWHDLLAFNNNKYARTFETSTDTGATWTAGPIEDKLFINKESQSLGPGNGFSLNAAGKQARWTWTDVGASGGPGMAYNGASWLVINWSYDLTITRTVLFESSLDGVTWTTRHTSSYSGSNLATYHYLQSTAGDRYLRLTIGFVSTPTGTPNLRFSSIRLLTNRAGDQGGGREVEFPYTWNASRWLGIGLNLADTILTPLHVKGDARVEGTHYVVSGGKTLAFDGNGINFSDTAASYIDQKGIGGSILFVVSKLAALDTTAMTIKSDGKVGIGTSAPADVLDVVGNARSSVAPTNAAHLTRKDYVDGADASLSMNIGIVADNLADETTDRANADAGLQNQLDNHEGRLDDIEAEANPYAQAPVISTQTIAYIATAKNEVVLANGTFTVTSDVDFGVLTVKNTGTGVITVKVPAPGLIDGYDRFILPNQYDSVTLANDGTNGYVL